MHLTILKQEILKGFLNFICYVTSQWSLSSVENCTQYSAIDQVKTAASWSIFEDALATWDEDWLTAGVKREARSRWGPTCMLQMHMPVWPISYCLYLPTKCMCHLSLNRIKESHKSSYEIPEESLTGWQIVWNVKHKRSLIEIQWILNTALRNFDAIQVDIQKSLPENPEMGMNWIGSESNNVSSGFQWKSLNPSRWLN